jgi:hypothetical protein
MSKLLGPGQAALVLSSIVPGVAAETSWTSCGNYGVALNAVAVGWAASRVCSGTIWKRGDGDFAHAKHGLITQTVSN